MNVKMNEADVDYICDVVKSRLVNFFFQKEKNLSIDLSILILNLDRLDQA